MDPLERNMVEGALDALVVAGVVTHVEPGKRESDGAMVYHLVIPDDVRVGLTSTPTADGPSVVVELFVPYHDPDQPPPEPPGRMPWERVE
ncbi:MAG: hypothetical protein WD598_17015 [Acidimicrobiia bacterium]